MLKSKENGTGKRADKVSKEAPHVSGDVVYLPWLVLRYQTSCQGEFTLRRLIQVISLLGMILISQNWMWTKEVEGRCFRLIRKYFK
jgi:hypothetical protein